MPRGSCRCFVISFPCTELLSDCLLHKAGRQHRAGRHQDAAITGGCRVDVLGAFMRKQQASACAAAGVTVPRAGDL